MNGTRKEGTTAGQGQFQQGSSKGPKPGTHFARFVEDTPIKIWRYTYDPAKPTRTWLHRFNKEKTEVVPIETSSTVSVFPPPVPPKEDVRPVIPTVYWQETPTRSRTPVFGRRQVDKLPAIKEESPEQSGTILTQTEEDILRRARIEFKKDIDGITARTILAAARNTVRTSVSGLYHDRQTHRVRSHLWDWIEVVTTNLSEIKRSSTIVGRSHQQVRDLLEHLKAVETILLQWQFEDLERPVWTEDIFH